MSWWIHVKDEAMDAVLDEWPQEPAHHKEDREKVLVDRDREAWEHTHMLGYRWLKQKCGHTNENENTSDCGTNTGVCELPEVRASLVVPCARVV